jgi:Ca2+-binding EF-hand superfamily protein
MRAIKSRLLLVPAGVFLLGIQPVAFGRDSAEEFKHMDTDADGRITRTEHAAVAQALFERLDTNTDGIITAAEMEPKDAKMDTWDKNEGISAAEKIAEIDADLDGQVTKSEHETSTALVFGRLDTDNDGYLSRAECEAGHKVLKKEKK